jgi:D-alanine-D-alanine ligase
MASYGQNTFAILIFVCTNKTVSAMKRLVILYAESEFTPWKENIDTYTVNFIRELLDNEYAIDIRHMEYPSVYLAKLLAQYDAVINLCYGFMDCSQSDIATWLDNHHVNHFSSPGWIQRQVQDKLWVEKKASSFGITVPESLSHDSILDHESLYILKPRFGSCHQGIHIMKGNSMSSLLNSGDYSNHLLQHYISGREFSVAVIPSDCGIVYRALPPVEIAPNSDRAIFIAGNTFGGTHRLFDYTLDNEVKLQLESASASFHQHLGLRYMSRLDFRVQGNKTYLLDVNAMPNLHPIKSLLPALLQHNGYTLKDLITNWIKINPQYAPVSSPQLLYV